MRRLLFGILGFFAGGFVAWLFTVFAFASTSYEAVLPFIFVCALLGTFVGAWFLGAPRRSTTD